MSFPNQPPGGVPAPPNAADEYAQAGVTREQLEQFARVNQAQTPAEYAAAANAAGLTGQAWQAAAGQVAAGVPAGPVPAPSFEEQLAEYQRRNAALEQRLVAEQAANATRFAQLSAQLAGVQAAVPVKVDPVTESAAKVVQAFKDIALTDARNILRSALHSHLVNLGLAELAKLI